MTTPAALEARIAVMAVQLEAYRLLTDALYDLIAELVQLSPRREPLEPSHSRPLGGAAPSKEDRP